MNKEDKKRNSKLFKYKNQLSRKATKAEIKFKDILDRNGIVYVFQKGVYTRDPITLKKRFRILDFYIRRCRIGIEIDGGYHFSEYGKRRDAYRDLELSRSRKTLIVWRFTNEEVLAESKEMMERIKYLKEGQEKRLKNHKEKLTTIDFLGDRTRSRDQEVIDSFKDKWQ
jgi:very-short-patch-repair endonuclease